MKRVFTVAATICYGSCKRHISRKANPLMFAPIFIFIFIFIFISLFISLFISTYFAILPSHRQAFSPRLATCAGVAARR